MIIRGLGEELILQGLGDTSSDFSLVCRCVALKSEVIGLVCNVSVESNVFASRTLNCSLVNLVEAHSFVSSGVVIRCFATDLFFNRLEVRQQSSKLLSSSLTVIYGAASRNLWVNTIVLCQNSSSLPMRLIIEPRPKAATTPSGMPRLLRKYKSHTLVGVAGVLEIKGTEVKQQSGFIFAFGSVVNAQSQAVDLSGSVLRAASGQARIEASRLAGVGGDLGSSGVCVSRIRGTLGCRGAALAGMKGEIALSGQKDIFPILVALNLAGMDTGARL